MCRYFIIFIIIPINIFAQQYDDSRSILEGVVCSSFDSSKLNDIHVVNITSDEVTASINNGIYRIPVKTGDNIYFSAVGYGLTPLLITDSILELKCFIFFLDPKIYELTVVDVMPYLTYKEFKKAFLALEFEDLKIDLRLPVYTVYKEFAPGQTSVSLSLITALYMEYSKEGKSLRKYRETVQKADYDKYIASKYNSEFVKNITDLEDDEVLKTFMEFCDFSDEFITKSCDYELIAAIMNCFTIFTK